MKFCGSHQIWIGIACIDYTAEEGKQGCAFIE
jgi:hypothetical protein